LPRQPRLLLPLAAISALVAGTLAVTGPASTAAPADAQSAALAKLKGDASGALTLRTDGSGRVTFAGVKAGQGLDVPGVSASSSVREAADAAVARYGAAFGAAQKGTTLEAIGAQSAVVGDVVRYRQEVGGLPVLGGELVVTLGADRSTRSILGETTRIPAVRGAKVSEATATSIAKSAFAKAEGAGAAPNALSEGRWVVDPSLVGLHGSLGARTGWRFDVTRGASERRMVVVDDQTGTVLINTDTIAHALKRIVCDNAETVQVETGTYDEVPCTDPATAARNEGEPPVGQEDVDTAYDLAGAVSNTYAGIGLDLTALIGRELTGTGAGQKALAQTVRLCYDNGQCPYENAFWNGKQMYYGTGYAVADDVVGHEMTHGVTERTSNLIYWGQSGAMNESISDIMGEIVDHQNVGTSDSDPTIAWALGEDVPGYPTGLRDMRDPGKFGDPDRTGSPNWQREDATTLWPVVPNGYPDQDGVHFNSGVGNKTFYLASQGGTFNGQTITGIDAGDPNLVKSAKLWLLTDQTLSSGSDYADEAAVLEQSCATLQAAGAMTAANCEAVHKATLATELRQTPVNAAQPPDAELACPGSAQPRVLFDSETGDPLTKFTPGAPLPAGSDGVVSVWNREGVEGWGPNAKSKPGSWAIADSDEPGATSLVATTGVALPAGRAAYLRFQQWRVLEYFYGSLAYNAGTVEVNAGGGPVDTASLPWVNGPQNTIAGTDNPAAGRKGFGTDSRGYTASRLDLSTFAGQTVKPQFTLNADESLALVGWYVDDIQIYTCDPKVTVGKVVAKGKAQVGKRLKAKVKGLQPGATVTYQWLRNGKAIKGATHKKYKLKSKDKGKKVKVVITATAPTYAPATEESKGRKVRPKPHHHR
jgi:bacillolysin